MHAVGRCSCATLASTGRTHRAIHERTTPPPHHRGRSNSEKRREAAFPPIVPVDYRVSQSGSHDAFSGLLLVPCPLQQRDPDFLCPRQHLVGPRPHTAQSQCHQVIRYHLIVILRTHDLLLNSTETLATMIQQLLPETLEYLENTNTAHYGSEFTSWSKSQVYGLTETQCFLSFLSAVLERNSPKDDEALSYTSRLSSAFTESRASSAMMSSYR